jgi:hypothetical protein
MSSTINGVSVTGESAAEPPKPAADLKAVMNQLLSNMETLLTVINQQITPN